MALDHVAVATDSIRTCLKAQEGLLEHDRLHAIVEAARLVSASLAGGGKLLVFGNGGSASDAAHLAAEFVGRFQDENCVLPAISLCANESVVTSISNDFGFDQVFARQIDALGSSKDVALAISTSGRSGNVLAGVRAARRVGMSTIGLTGADGDPLGATVDVCVRVPARSTARIQESHILVVHILCELVERELT